mmetsp:Transcript_37598/g.112702  ORF Transcript_37598/g.112702 Transcript_37598/m.112702 type:complete len:136 (-) Transcript_37598:222-629(-)
MKLAKPTSVSAKVRNMRNPVHPASAAALYRASSADMGIEWCVAWAMPYSRRFMCIARWQKYSTVSRRNIPCRTCSIDGAEGSRTRDTKVLMKNCEKKRPSRRLKGGLLGRSPRDGLSAGDEEDSYNVGDGRKGGR